MSEMLELLTYPFVYRALVAGSLISVCASVLGVILVLKHYALIGHGLSEVGFASLSVAAALGLPVMLVSAPAVIIASFLIMFVSQRFRTAGDSAIAIASSAALALGVIVSSLTGQTSAMNSWLFGSVLAVGTGDVVASAVLFAVVMGTFAVFYNRLFLITYNEDYARSLGISTTFYQFMISALTALVVVAGMRITGTLLISGLVILPAVAARRLAKSFLGLAVMSGIVSLVSFVGGLVLSFMVNIPAGAAVILVNTILLILVRVIA